MVGEGEKGKRRRPGGNAPGDKRKLSRDKKGSWNLENPTRLEGGRSSGTQHLG